MTITIPANSVGVIIDKTTNKALGSGFVAGSKRQVVTCAHVASKGSYQFKLSGLMGAKPIAPVDITLVYSIPKYDLAFFALADTAAVNAVPFGDGKRIRPGDQVIYMGLKGGTNTIIAAPAIVSAVGCALNDGAVVEFLEFQGQGVPGFSGGPVFDASGRVVAVMREAWTKKSVRGGKEILVNRAFSADLLAILDAHVQTKPTAGIPSPSATSVDQVL